MDKPTIVIKVGTSSLVDTKTGTVQVSAIARLTEVTSKLLQNYHVVIVTSGAVGLGCSRLGLTTKPSHIAGKQAAAAIGQLRLMSLYDDFFSVLGHKIAQVLLTYDTFGDRTQYLNARNTFLELLRLGCIPVVNENDTVAVQELRVGDNDSLSALVAAMVGAQWLFLLTDVESLYNGNPKDNPSAAPIRIVRSMTELHNLRKQMTAGVSPLQPSLTLEQAQLASVTAGVAALESSTSMPSSRARSVSPSEAGATNGSRSRRGSGAGAGPSSPGRPDAATATGTAAAGHQHAHPKKNNASTAAVSAGAAGSQWGTGGMVTKLKAAMLGTAAGVTVVIMNTQRIERIENCLNSAAVAHAPASGAAPTSPALSGATAANSAADGAAASSVASASPATPLESAEAKTSAFIAAAAANGHAGTPAAARTSLAFADIHTGTTFLPSAKPVTAGRKRWILSLNCEGSLVLDRGAAAAVVDSRKSLFPAGVVAIEGDFDAHDAVAVLNEDRIEIARALVNYSSDDCRKLKGKKSKDIQVVLGYLGAEALCDRDNIVVVLSSATVAVAGQCTCDSRHVGFDPVLHQSGACGSVCGTAFRAQ